MVEERMEPSPVPQRRLAVTRCVIPFEQEARLG